MNRTSPPPVFIDTRWSGQHGIGRYAREVVSRLPDSFRRVESRLSPTSPLDVIFAERLRLSRSALWYSPGFNAGYGKAEQLVTIHDLIHLDSPGEKSILKSQYYERVVKPQVLKTGMVLTVSDSSAHRIREWLSTDSVDIRVTRCGLSPEFRQDTTAPASKTTDLLYVGNLKPHKNVDLVLSALQQESSLSMTIVTSDVPEAEKSLSEHGLLNRVRVLTGLDDAELAETYRASAALVMPSIYEGFGLPALEASACGVPVLHWSGCTSVAEIVGQPEYSFESLGDASELSELMKMAANGSLPAPTKGKSWRAAYSWDHAAEVVKDSISELTEGSR